MPVNDSPGWQQSTFRALSFLIPSLTPKLSTSSVVQPTNLYCSLLNLECSLFSQLCSINTYSFSFQNLNRQALSYPPPIPIIAVIITCVYARDLCGKIGVEVRWPLCRVRSLILPDVWVLGSELRSLGFQGEHLYCLSHLASSIIYFHMCVTIHFEARVHCGMVKSSQLTDASPSQSYDCHGESHTAWRATVFMVHKIRMCC
jgi:hypothetical protein